MSGSPGNGNRGNGNRGNGNRGNGNSGNGNSGNGQANSNGGGPGNGRGRGPPQRVREKFRSSKREDDGTIWVGDDPLAQIAEQVDWDNLSAFDEYVLAVLVERDLIENPSE